MDIPFLTSQAQKGDVKSQLHLAQCYMDGVGVDEDHEQAAYWYGQASEQGDRGGISSLAALYYTGWGVPQDSNRAVELYTKAAEMGDNHAALSAAKMLIEGDGVEKNLTESARLLTLAENDSSVPEAAYLLAIQCYQGQGVEKDTQRSWALLKRASDWGLKQATVMMERFPSALLEDIAQKGDAYAQLIMGNRYVSGTDVELDFQKAYQLFSQSAEGGCAAAQNNLGIMLEHGDGVRRNLQESLRWYREAEHQGHPGAADSARRVEQMIAVQGEEKGCMPVLLCVAVIVSLACYLVL